MSSDPHPSRQGRARLALALESACFTAVLYKAGDHCLLLRDGAEPWSRGVPMLLLYLLAIALIHAASRPALKLLSRERLVDEYLVAFLLLAFVVGLSLRTPVKGETGLWIPLEWHKIGRNIQLAAAVSPGGAIFLFGAWLVTLSGLTGASRSRSHLVLISSASAIGIAAALMPAGEKLIIYFTAFGLPLLFASAAIHIGWLRWGNRLALVGAIGNLIFLNYMGVLPFTVPNDLPALPGVTRIYPVLARSPDVPMGFIRDLHVDEARRLGFASYGPACGLARFNLDTGQLVLHPTEGLVRYLWTEDSIPTLMAVDWDRGEFLELDKASFETTRKVDLVEGSRVSPWFFAVSEDRVFISFHEAPILAAYARDSLELLAERRFRDLGITRFNSGLLKVTYLPQPHRLFAELGMVDSGDTFRILELDPHDLSITRWAVLPEGGLEIIAVPERNSLIAASFFSNRLYEFDLESLNLKRILEGPLNSRNLAFDERRGLLYALAFLPGKLYVLDFESGGHVATVGIGRKPQSMVFRPDTDRLYVGSEDGIYQIELEPFLGAARP